MYQWDEDKAAANLRKHKIDFADAVSVFSDDRAITILDERFEEERFVTMGLDAFGRVLVVVYTMRGNSANFCPPSHSPRTTAIFGGIVMKAEYDFSHGKRGAITPTLPGKTRITLQLDEDVLVWFQEQVHLAGGGDYHTLINEALRQHIQQHQESLVKQCRDTTKIGQ